MVFPGRDLGVFRVEVNKKGGLFVPAEAPCVYYNVFGARLGCIPCGGEMKGGLFVPREGPLVYYIGFLGETWVYSAWKWKKVACSFPGMAEWCTIYGFFWARPGWNPCGGV